MAGGDTFCNPMALVYLFFLYMRPSFDITNGFSSAMDRFLTLLGPS